MAKRKAEWQNKYIAKAYDRVNLTLPKGRKAKAQEYAASKGESLNGYINRLIEDDMKKSGHSLE